MPFAVLNPVVVQVPPVGEAVIVNTAAFVQILDIGVIVGVIDVITVIVDVPTLEHVTAAVGETTTE